MKFKAVFVSVIALIILSCGALPPEFKKLEELTIFKVSSDKQSIVLDGVINSSAFKEFKKLTSEYPAIKLLEIINCEGSINDEVNLKLAHYVHQHKFDTHLNDNGIIASGGTDLFLAGKKRSLGENIRIGVHSWGDGEKIQATDFPRGHKYHQPYIAYYQSIGATLKEAENFYYFTINAASANNIHWMNIEEIEKYEMVNTNSPIIVYKEKPIEISNDIPASFPKEIIGKWKLESLIIEEERVSPKEVMGTSEVYQNYEVDNNFISSVGKQLDRGTWAFSKETQSILIKNSGITETFKIAYFKNKQMTLVLNQGGKEFLLNYNKVK